MSAHVCVSFCVCVCVCVCELVCVCVCKKGVRGWWWLWCGEGRVEHCTRKVFPMGNVWQNG